MALDPEERSLRQRLGARQRIYERLASGELDPRALAKAGQEGQLRSYEEKLDPNHELAPDERRRRAKWLRQARLAEGKLNARRNRRGKRGS